jgi:hypothetical protein
MTHLDLHIVLADRISVPRQRWRMPGGWPSSATAAAVANALAADAQTTAALTAWAAAIASA